MYPSRRFFSPVISGCLSALSLALLVVACGSSDPSSNASSSSSSSGSSGQTSPPVSTADCQAGCQAKSEQCGAPAATATSNCESICGGTLTQAQLSCLESKPCEDLAAIDDPSSLAKVCPAGSNTGTDGGTTPSTAGKFGDACKCKPDTSQGAGDFECSGTNICSSGLSCVGSRIQGVDKGTCVGPKCCSGEADCAEKLGQQANCASGQICRCTRGDLECVGSKCTCGSGVAGSRGLCWKE